jgi:CubicO group peptidase (beta-lactamase class C family)
MKIRLLAVTTLCLLILSCFGQRPKQLSTKDRFAGLDTAFARVLYDWKAAGFAVAVVEKDKLVYAKGFGYQDWQARKPVTVNTQFAIGSCTKAFTASLIGLLDSSGKLDLDKPVRTYLPELHFYNSEMDQNITLRDMMCHRTGIPRYDWSWSVYPSTRDTLLQRIQFMEPTQPLRQKFQYNNFMFMLQGLVAEKLTGKSWEQNVRQSFLEPLGMQHSYLSYSDCLQSPDLSLGYNVKQDSFVHQVNYENEQGMSPAGSIISTVPDMAKWLTLWIQGGKLKGRQLLPAAYMKAATKPQMIVDDWDIENALPDILLSAYGFGWFLSGYRGHYRVEHGGNVTGFSASACFFPTDSIGIVVLCNQDGSAVPSVVRNIIADKMLGAPYRDWESILFNQYLANRKKEQEVKNTKHLQVTHPPTHPLGEYTGTYTTAAGETVNVWQRNDSLFVKTATGTYWYRLYNYDVFEILPQDDVTGEIDTTAATPLKVTFSIDEAGMITGLSCVFPDGNAKPAVFTRVKMPSAEDKVPKNLGQ